MYYNKKHRLKVTDIDFLVVSFADEWSPCAATKIIQTSIAC